MGVRLVARCAIGFVVAFASAACGMNDAQPRAELAPPSAQIPPGERDPVADRCVLSATRQASSLQKTLQGFNVETASDDDVVRTFKAIVDALQSYELMFQGASAMLEEQGEVAGGDACLLEIATGVTLIMMGLPSETSPAFRDAQELASSALEMLVDMYPGSSFGAEAEALRQRYDLGVPS